jgi:hypothetical protein
MLWPLKKGVMFFHGITVIDERETDMLDANSWGIYLVLPLLLLLLLGVAEIKSMIKSHTKKLEEAEAEKIALLTNIDRNIAGKSGKSLHTLRLDEQQEIARLEEAAMQEEIARRKFEEDELNRTWNKT